MLVAISVKSQFQPDTVHIREVQVLAKRKIEEAGLKITRPDSLQRASMLTTNLSELLSDYSPVFIKSNGRGSEPSPSRRCSRSIISTASGRSCRQSNRCGLCAAPRSKSFDIFNDIVN